MGVRLYPNTTNERSLEILCDVPEGTAEMLHALEKYFGTSGEAFYKVMFSKGNENVHTYRSFLLFGWGKFCDTGIAKGYAGELKDPELIAKLFLANNIIVPLEICEGIHWS